MSKSNMHSSWLLRCRLTIDEARTIIDAHRIWVVKEIREICTMLRERGIRRYTISRVLYDAFQVALYPNIYSDARLIKEGFDNITTFGGIIFLPAERRKADGGVCLGCSRTQK